MKKYSTALILLNLMLVVVYFIYAIRQKEYILTDGTLVKMELAPADPRSLMQGDYMALNYKEANKYSRFKKGYDSIPARGFAVLKIADNKVAHILRLQKNKTPLSPGETLMEYNKTRFSLSIGAESFFFQEGTAHIYDHAKYGVIRVDEEGRTVLVCVE